MEIAGLLLLPLAALPFALLIAILSLPAQCRSPHTPLPDPFAWPRRKLRRLSPGSVTIIRLRPPLKPEPWPQTVVQLAAALNGGADCGFALHDALLEAGLTDAAVNPRAADCSRESPVVRTILGT